MNEDDFERYSDLVIATQQARRRGWEFNKIVYESWEQLQATRGGINPRYCRAGQDVLEFVEQLP